MFRGHAYRNIDPKGRLMLPPEFRERVVADSAEGKFMLAKFDSCVNGYPLDVWSDIERKISSISNPSTKVRNFKRFFLGSAQEVQLDKQGRILIPPSLRDYGNLVKEVVLVGVGSKFEIWDKARFEEVENMDFGDVFNDIAQSGVEVSL